MIVRNLNTMYKWAYENGYIDKSIKYEGGNRWESRHRVINNDELEILFKEVSDDRFNKFIRFFTKRWCVKELGYYGKTALTFNSYPTKIIINVL